MVKPKLDDPPRLPANRRQLLEIIARLNEGLMLIDPDRSIVWANAAAVAAHRVADRAALGATIDDYMARFALRFRNFHRLEGSAHPMERLAAGDSFGELTVELLQDGPEPSAVLRLRGLVLDDDAGQPESLVLIIDDASDVFGAEERFERTFNANPAPAVICRLADLRYVKVNQGFLQMTGTQREQIIGASVYEIDVLADVADRELVLARLREGTTIPQQEVQLSLPGGGSKLAIVAGQPLEVGEDRCMLFTFMDLEPRRRAEAALRSSEERFAKSFRLAPVATTLMARDTLRLLDVNQAFAALTGHPADHARGRTPATLPLWADRAAGAAIERALIEPGGCRDLEVQIRTQDGALCDCLLSAECIRAAPGLGEDPLREQDCILMVLQDITERRRSELDLMGAIDAVMQDTTWFSRTIAEKIANLRRSHGPGPKPLGLGDLTRREQEALTLICRGLKDAAMAGEMGLKLNTVRNHVASLYAKIGVHSRAEAIIWGRERGVTGTPPARRPAR